MKQQKATVACLLLFILALAVQASDLGKFQRPNRRALLQRNATSDAPPDEPQSEVWEHTPMPPDDIAEHNNRF